MPELDYSEIPDSCTCTWSWGPPSFRWERIGVKEDCPAVHDREEVTR